MMNLNETVHRIQRALRNSGAVFYYPERGSTLQVKEAVFKGGKIHYRTKGDSTWKTETNSSNFSIFGA